MVAGTGYRIPLDRTYGPDSADEQRGKACSKYNKRKYPSGLDQFLFLFVNAKKNRNEMEISNRRKYRRDVKGG